MARAPKKPAGNRGKKATRSDSDSETESGTSVPIAASIPTAPWSDLSLPLASTGREAHSVPAANVSVKADPAILSETARESHGLFELISPVSRRALELGLAARESSFLVFVSVEPEVMIEDDVARHAEHYAKGRPAPPDIVYVHDFDHPAAPSAILLPAGTGHELVEKMAAVIVSLGEQIPQIAKEDIIQQGQLALGKELEARNRAVLGELEGTAKKLGFGIRSVPGGMQTFAVLHGKPLSAEQFAVLDESTKRALSEAEEKLTSEVEKASMLVRQESLKFEAARNEQFSQAAEALIHAHVEEVRKIFAEHGEGVQKYFDQVERALIADWEDLVQSEDAGDEADEKGHSSGGLRDHDPEHAKRLDRFRVNLLVSNDPASPPPVVYETNPTYPNLFGYLERRAKFGALLTDFTRIRPGALQRASGGFLIVRAADLMADPIIWERMKRILRERRIGAEDPLGPLGLYATSLRPAPVPISVRVILVGSPDLYAALLSADPDFASLFRIKVEVESFIPRSENRLVLLDGYLMSMAKEREWGKFDRPARARLLDLATRLAGDQGKLSVALSPLEETAAFASALAVARTTNAADEIELSSRDESHLPFRASIAPPAKTVVTAEDVEIAWKERRDRAGAAERHIRDLTLRGEVNLETTGTRVGVVNALSVYSAGDVEFGQPIRITAVVALGREGIIDVEREASLGGSIHTKGLAIVRGYLGLLFGQERPLSLRAQIAFEQSYGEVDGDSASSSELYAVLSALSEVPLDQGIAVTGSVNQLGEIQAIGGVCAKIEGFFDLAAARGLNGKQGVLIPRTNIPHLVLREDVTKAIDQGKFHLYAVSTVEEGIEILAGIPAGKRDTAGRFPASSVFGRVERRIIEMAERLRKAEGAPAAEHHELLEDSSNPELAEAGEF